METKVTDANQTQVPARLRAKYGIRPGDFVIWDETDEEIRIRFRSRRPLSGLVGLVPGVSHGDAVASKKDAQRRGL